MPEKNKVFFPWTFDVHGWRFAPGRETSSSAYTIHILIKTRAHLKKKISGVYIIYIEFQVLFSWWFILQINAGVREWNWRSFPPHSLLGPQFCSYWRKKSTWEYSEICRPRHPKNWLNTFEFALPAAGVCHMVIWEACLEMEELPNWVCLQQLCLCRFAIGERSKAQN